MAEREHGGVSVHGLTSVEFLETSLSGVNASLSSEMKPPAAVLKNKSVTEGLVENSLVILPFQN